jgi:sRNA-binding protein
MASQAIADIVAHVTKVIAGMKKRFPNGSQVLQFGGGTHTVDEVTTALQAIVTNRTAVDTAKAALQVALDADEAAAPALLALLAALTKFLRSMFGTTADALADFDLDPPKVPAVRTAAEKAVAAAKGLATRKARGTGSAKQKKSVKGNVTATLVVTPAPAAPEPAPVTEAAPAAASPTPATPKSP